MKGTLQYVSKDKTLVKSWVVWYNEQPDGGNVTFVDSLPLHPDDVNEINAWQQIFDNIEARIAANQEVGFEVVDVWENGEVGVNGIRYAKLIKEDSTEAVPDYPELEGTINLCEDIIEKKTGKMTEEEWQAAERAQTSIEWLRNELVNNENIRWRGTNINVLIEQAKEMHKAEILAAFTEGASDGFYGESDSNREQYYQETFGSKGSDDKKINLVEIPQEQLEKERNANYKYFSIDEPPEISDEEIEKEAKNHHNYYEWSAGAKWYKEQLKRNNEKE